MSLVIKTHVFCDNCGATFGADNPHCKGMQQRQSARQNGWCYSGNKDYCPNCIPNQHKQPKKINIGRNFYLEKLCRQNKIIFENGTLVSHMLLENAGIKTDQFKITWPGNTIDGSVIYRQITTPRTKNGGWGKACVIFFLNKNLSPDFDSLELLIEHYAKK